MSIENSPTFTGEFTHPAYSPNELIQSINQQTPVSINLESQGYVWSWKCLESEAFATPLLALIDWMNHVSQSYEDVLIDSLQKDEICEEKHIEWKEIDPENLPKGDVLAAMFYDTGGLELLMGKLSAEYVNADFQRVDCESSDCRILRYCTHYIDKDQLCKSSRN